ncbi:MAG: helix-turn-helix domain-containing protein [Ruminococcaceae bacterium]|nr:helix-turn-helix domain-containing protein [Oscillospiraceae bacterium]
MIESVKKREKVDKMNEEFAKRLVSLRKEAKINQKQLGALIGVSDRAVSKWECGLSRPSLDACYALSRIFKVPLDELIATDNKRAEAQTKRRQGMSSLKFLFKVGPGPSSSHTLAASRASKLFLDHHADADSFKVILYGSLAKTGYGHGTEKAIKDVFENKTLTLELDYLTVDIPHHNTMDFIALSKGEELDKWRIFSVGGGTFEVEGKEEFSEKSIYPHSTFDEICRYIKEKNMRIPDYVEETEGSDIWEWLGEIWNAMKESIERGLVAEGILPGGLEVQRKAKTLYKRGHIDESAETKENRLVCSFAYAVSEENASGGVVVTAPTCGASGLLPAVLRYQQIKRGYSDREICRALAVAGLIGNIIKTNASISGAECGCQAEIGSACSMAAAALGELFEMDIEQIEYAAEVAMEHHLGLTCDPIRGLVQIPCIERNAVGAMRAIQAVNLANFLSDTRKISFDIVVQTMYETGKDMSKIYRETAEGGLAKLY